MPTYNNANNTTNSQIVGNGYKLPTDFNNTREPGQILRLFELNSEAIYNKYSPKTNHYGLLTFGPRQPFVTSTPNHHSTLFNTRAFPLGSAVDDVKRISKWQLTGDGIIFLAKQFFLQRGNAFNETRTFNPLMPIQSVLSNLSFGAIPTPMRFIDLTNFASSLGFGSSDTAPKNTVGKNAISKQSSLSGNASKGLLRGKTSSDAYGTFNSKWSTESSGNQNIIANYFKSGFNKIFNGMISQKQPENTTVRGDEGSYGIMLGSKGKFASFINTFDGSGFNSVIDTSNKGVNQMWNGGADGANGIRKNGDDKTGPNRSRFLKTGNIKSPYQLISLQGPFNGTSVGTFPKIGTFEVGLNPNSGKIQMYGSSVGSNISTEEPYKNSEMLINYAYYADPTQKYPSKFIGDKTVDPLLTLNNILEKTINGLASKDINANDEQYIIESNYSPLAQFGKTGPTGYNYIANVGGKTAESKKLSYFNATRFSSIRTLDPVPDAIGVNNFTYGFAGSHRSDKINTTGVISGKEFGDGKAYDPSASDLIPFYFYDMVNDKYIPFRAILKGISESSTAEWNDIMYIGRADKLFSYKGFTRTLGFNFTVHISSIKELLPTWQRINYFMSLVKPANYTANSNYPTFSRFIIPPFLKVTIGDLYSDQPAIMTTIGFSIPDDSTWETTDARTFQDEEWAYLNNTIIWKDSANRFARLPRTIEFSIAMNLLEKEKPVMGGAQFGSSYRDENSNKVNDGTFSSALIV